MEEDGPGSSSENPCLLTYVDAAVFFLVLETHDLSTIHHETCYSLVQAIYPQTQSWYCVAVKVKVRLMMVCCLQTSLIDRYRRLLVVQLNMMFVQPLEVAP